ncbi:MAG TPA: PIG-L family deacetylase [Blastocatellia bacterium]|nr:PIG-L family deacetylase [Blastocatellia bacterium]HMY70331.1 PIG-L family deacetylase [Blastocatellia bacterium]
MKRAAIFGLFLCFTYLVSLPATSAQMQEPAENKGAAAAWRALLRLRSTATVLHTTAHPDDEDGAMLTWLTRHEGIRTGLLTLNRGEGGANVVGPELYDALGVLRTEELLAAGRYYGVDQMFTRVTDFGFSKRMDETIEHWGKDVVLKDVVHAVRLYRPDVIISRFHGKPRDGHGNHQTAGLMSAEVFKAAADPNMFPEHFKEGLRPWQVKKLYRSVGGFGGGRGGTPDAVTVKVDVGTYDPLLGRSYVQISRYGLGFQRSQNGGGSLAAPGSSISSWLLEESVVGKKETEESILESLDTTIPGLAKLAGSLNISAELTSINNSVEAAIKKFDARQPWLSANDLAAGKSATTALIQKVKAASVQGGDKDHLLFLLGNKENEFNDAMNKALGLVMEVLVDPPARAEGPGGGFGQPRETFNVAIPGQQFSLTMSVVNRSPVQMSRGETIIAPRGNWEIKAKTPSGGLPVNNSTLKAQFDIKVADDAEYSRPYWSRASELREHIYQINKPEYLHLPFAPPELMGWFNYEVGGVRFHLTQPAQTVYIDRPWGEQRRLLTVAPAIGVGLSPRVGVVPVGAVQTSFNVAVNVLNNVKGDATGKVRLKLPTGWTATPADQSFHFTHEGEISNFAFKVSVPRVSAGDADFKIQAVADYAGREYTEGYEVIAHRDNEPRHLYRPATMAVRGVSVNVAPNLNVGYVMGVGDEIPKALEQIGVKVTMLNESDLAGGNLDQFDAILIGIRATAVRDDLKAYSKRLLDYCERGGNLVYQYQTQEFDAAPYGPYPYKLGARAEEVSEEDSKVTILDPTNPIFNGPNKITVADFDGWVEERGSKWMSTWDERYKPLLECNDRQQAPQKGGLMYAQHGKGTFVYAAYAFYRQLPAGVQGGYRLFANIVSLKKRAQ